MNNYNSYRNPKKSRKTCLVPKLNMAQIIEERNQQVQYSEENQKTELKESKILHNIDSFSNLVKDDKDDEFVPHLETDTKDTERKESAKTQGVDFSVNEDDPDYQLITQNVPEIEKYQTSNTFNR
jgi:hypothetical protein